MSPFQDRRDGLVVHREGGVAEAALRTQSGDDLALVRPCQSEPVAGNGEPRVATVDDTTYVSVPEFELWPTDPDWTPSDASIVFIEGRSLTMARPGRGVYHLSRRWTYGSVTRCGRIIWAPTSSPEHEKVSLVPIRRDNASRIARPCRICGAETEEP